MKKASPFSNEAVEFIVGMPCEGVAELIDKTYAVVTIFSGMRKEDLYSTRSIDVSTVSATQSCGRYICFAIQRMIAWG